MFTTLATLQKHNVRTCILGNNLGQELLFIGACDFSLGFVLWGAGPIPKPAPLPNQCRLFSQLDFHAPTTTGFNTSSGGCTPPPLHKLHIYSLL